MDNLNENPLQEDLKRLPKNSIENLRIIIEKLKDLDKLIKEKIKEENDLIEREKVVTNKYTILKEKKRKLISEKEKLVDDKSKIVDRIEEIGKEEKLSRREKKKKNKKKDLKKGETRDSLRNKLIAINRKMKELEVNEKEINQKLPESVKEGNKLMKRLKDMNSSFEILYKEDLMIKREMRSLTSVIVEDYELEDLECEESLDSIKPVELVEVIGESSLNKNKLYKINYGNISSLVNWETIKNLSNPFSIGMELERRKVRILSIRTYEETQDPGKWRKLENIEDLLLKKRKVKILSLRNYEETQDSGKWREVENIEDLILEKRFGKMSIHEENGKSLSYGETEVVSWYKDKLESQVVEMKVTILSEEEKDIKTEIDENKIKPGISDLKVEMESDKILIEKLKLNLKGVSEENLKLIIALLRRRKEDKEQLEEKEGELVRMKEEIKIEKENTRLMKELNSKKDKDIIKYKMRVENWKNYYRDLEEDHFRGLFYFRRNIEKLEKECRISSKGSKENVEENEKKWKNENLSLKIKIKDLESEVERGREEKRKMDKEMVEEKSKIGKLRSEVYLKGERCERLKSLCSYNKNLYDTANRVIKNLKDRNVERIRPGSEENENKIRKLEEELKNNKENLEEKVKEVKRVLIDKENSKKENEKIKKNLKERVRELEEENQSNGEIKSSEEEVTRLKIKVKDLSNWYDILVRDLDFLENLVKKIDGKINEGCGKQFPISEDLEMFSRFVKEEIKRQFQQKIGRLDGKELPLEEFEDNYIEDQYFEKEFYGYDDDLDFFD